MKNKTINLSVVEEVAIALAELKEKMVFVGGAVVSLYADDPAADEIRPTQDIDMTLKIVSFSEWAKLEETLRSLNIFPDPFGHSICSYRYKDIPLDIIPANNQHIGQSNKWYKYGFESLLSKKLNKISINILQVSCYLAAKFEAFNDRGTDYRTSHDFEDIIYVIDNNKDIVNEILSSKIEVLEFLQKELLEVYKSGYWEEILTSHIHPLIIDERAPILTDKILNIIDK